MKVLVIGSLGYDYIMDFDGRFSERILPDKVHKISLSFLVNKLQRNFGGTAGNIAYTLRLLGVIPDIIAPVGHDFSPYKQFLKSHGISISHIKSFSNEPCGSYYVVTDQDDNQIGAYYSGAMKYAKNLPLPKDMDQKLIIISPTDPLAMVMHALECQKRKISYVFDPAFQIGSISESDLAKCIDSAKILIGNDYEIALIEKKLSLSHSELLSKTSVLITTLGHDGSVIETSKQKIKIRPAKPLNTSDPTGAGDAYRGGFIAGYIRGFNLQTCGQMGSTAAVYTVEKFGTITHHYTIKDFIKRYREDFAQNLVL